MSEDFIKMDYLRTVATMFMVRPLGLCEKSESLNPEDSNACKIIKKFGFKEAYFADKDHETTIIDPVFLLFRPKNIHTMQDFIKSEYAEYSNLKEDYDYEGGWIVLVYEFPDIYKTDFSLIRRGKYSQCSKSFKEVFPKSVPKGNKHSIWHYIFNRDKVVRDAINQQFDTNLGESDELWHLPDMKKETLDISKFKDDV